MKPSNKSKFCETLTVYWIFFSLLENYRVSFQVKRSIDKISLGIFRTFAALTLCLQKSSGFRKVKFFELLAAPRNYMIFLQN